jgi:5-(carboxyamino)imidazole ribonucleotide mutase
MPGGIPVATVAIGNAKNAGLLAVQMLAIGQSDLLNQIQAYRQQLTDQVMAKQARLSEIGYQQYLAE